MRPAFRRGWEGEGKPNRRLGAGQRERSDRHSGRLFCFGNERAKPLAFPPTRRRSRQAPPAAPRHRNGTLARRDARRMECARNCASAPIRQGERQECQRVGSRRRTLSARPRAAESDLRKSRSIAAGRQDRPSPCDSSPAGRDAEGRLGEASPRRRVAE